MRRIIARARERLASGRGPEPAGVPGIESSAAPDEREILAAVRDRTMTTPERQLALVDAVTYAELAALPGAFVECGVWRGGSVLAMVLRLEQLGGTARDVYMYDTFTGMTRPTELDTSDFHRPALEDWRDSDGSAYPELFGGDDTSLEAVQALLSHTAHPQDRLHFVVGPVEETIPGTVPDRIALLRLDTDWYESTRHELEHLYPRVVPGGVVIIDDYGHWQGCRRAVDEYLDRADVAYPLMHRTDYTCRMWIKPRSA